MFALKLPLIVLLASSAISPTSAHYLRDGSGDCDGVTAILDGVAYTCTEELKKDSIWLMVANDDPKKRMVAKIGVNPIGEAFLKVSAPLKQNLKERTGVSQESCRLNDAEAMIAYHTGADGLTVQSSHISSLLGLNAPIFPDGLI